MITHQALSFGRELARSERVRCSSALKERFSGDYDDVVLGRRSTRGYKKEPVPQALIEEILTLAMRSPSSMNTQPWNFTVVSGEVLDRIRAGNTERNLAGVPHSREFRIGQPFAGEHRDRQVGVAKQLFAAMGIAREDKEGRQDWVLRGFRQFDAPVCVIITYDRVLADSDDTAFDMVSNPARMLLAGMQYTFFKSGVATSNGLEAGGFLKTRPELDVPDVQIHFLAAMMRDHGRLKSDRHGFTVHVCQLRPESRGYIGLRSANPADPALIQPNYLEAERDREVMRDATRMARDIIGQQAMDPYRGPEFWPGESRQSDADIDAWIRETAETIYHPVGTAKMGHDPMAVVDERCRVHGIEGLRVIDASVMPTLVGGNTNAPTIMIAEKIADDLRGRTPPTPMEVEIAEDRAASAA